MKIDTSLVRLKIHYLLHGMGGSPIVPFGSLIGRQLGVTPEGIGFIFAVGPIFGMLIKPTLGGIADKYGIKRLVLMFVILSATCLYYSLQYLPSIPIPPLAPTMCSERESCVVVNRDPCLPGKLQRLYGNKSVTCQFHCQFPSVYSESLAKKSIHFIEKREEDNVKDKEYFATGYIYPGLVQDIEKKLHIPAVLGKCDDEINFNCRVECEDDPQLSDLVSRSFSMDKSGLMFSNKEFWYFLVVITLAGISFGCGCTFQESICHEILGEEGERRYGEQRLWASVGWGLSAAIAGYLVDVDSQDSLSYVYTSAFRMMVLFWVADIFVVSGLKNIPEKAGESSNPWKDVSKCVQRKETLAFLFWCAAVGFGFSAMGLHFWLLEDLGGTKTCDDVQNMKLLQGLCLTVNCIGETPIFFISGLLIAKLGNRLSMTAVLVAHGSRLLFYSQIVTPWQILPIELVQGITFGLFYPCLVSVSQMVAPVGAETTMTTLAFIVFDGLGCCFGGWVSGKTYQAVGGSMTFWYFGLATMGAAVVNWFLLDLTGFQNLQESKKIAVS